MSIQIRAVELRDGVWGIACTCGYEDSAAGRAVPRLIADHQGLHVDRGEANHLCGFIENRQGRSVGFYCSCGHVDKAFENYPNHQLRTVQISASIRAHLGTHPRRLRRAA